MEIKIRLLHLQEYQTLGIGETLVKNLVRFLSGVFLYH